MDKNPNTEELLAALREIAKQELFEIMLDPDWPRRISKAAIASAEQAHAAKDGPTLQQHAELFGQAAALLKSYEHEGCQWDADVWSSVLALAKSASDHHHEAGGAPGREDDEDAKLERIGAAWDEAWEIYSRHQGGDPGDECKGRDAACRYLLAHFPSDQQGREQVIGELCEALEGDDYLFDEATADLTRDYSGEEA